MSSPDLMNIERLRKENLEQFLTLVRMHLSFIVDICTDDVDGAVDKPKQFRWNFNKKIKNCANNSSQSNIKDAKNEQSPLTEEGITKVYELIDYLSKSENVTQEGIFRRTGSLARQQELRQLLMSGSSLTLDNGRFSVHDCASVLKGFLADLPQPLLMEHSYQTYCTLAAQYPPTSELSEPKLLTALQLLLLLLMPVHRDFLQRLLRLLKLAADHEASNRMSPDTLATMFTPHLLCPRKLSPETFHTEAIALAPLISFMIRHSERLFTAPAQLATDVTAYFTVRERKKMLSPDIDLDESITDRTAANTVYTFVDRQRTVMENSSNPTDTALAQLYAHIQALPDSQHKRRLVKMFNRQNGYGTPIQVQRTGKAAGSRSFGDSIKRHIFNKGLLNKTPKKASATSINSIEEKITNKLRNDDKIDVSHKSVVLKNLANKMATIDYDDIQNYDSDTSNESTLSEGALNSSKKHSPKFVSEPNLSLLDTKADEETPKNTKKNKRLFRSKMLPTHTINKRYQKRGTILKSTPTSCVPCFDDQETGSETDFSLQETGDNPPLLETPKKRSSNCDSTDNPINQSETDKDFCPENSMQEAKLPSKLNYLTSTPGISEDMRFEECGTPYTITFRRASMSPITKSTQKLSKAMQESIMTPRSRKPLIVTSLEQRDSLPDNKLNPSDPREISKHSEAYHTMTPKNDSDFVSSDDDNGTSNFSTSRQENIRFALTHERLAFRDEFASHSGSFSEKSTQKSLTQPFREYLLSRSVLTATPVDLSILNKSSDTDDKITDSLMFCLDGNMPNDLTSSINSLAVGRIDTSSILGVDKIDTVSLRSPLKNIDSFVNIDACGGSNRKRVGAKDGIECDTKKALLEKENLVSSDAAFELRETEL